MTTTELLYVDSYTPFRRLVEHYFADADVAVATASTIDCCLDALRDRAFDCVVADYGASRGTDAHAAIREVDESVPVVYYTTYADEGAPRRLREAGAAAVVDKGEGLDALERTLSRVACESGTHGCGERH